MPAWAIIILAIVVVAGILLSNLRDIRMISGAADRARRLREEREEAGNKPE